MGSYFRAKTAIQSAHGRKGGLKVAATVRSSRSSESLQDPDPTNGPTLAAAPEDTSTRYFFLTFIDDIGNTSDRAPQVNLPAIQRKVDKATRAIGLHGVGVIEVQALMNYPGKGHGRTLLFHAHAIAWTTVRA